MFIKIFAPFLFWAPYAYQRALQEMWVYGVLHTPAREEAMKKLDEEWRDFILLVPLSLLL